MDTETILAFLEAHDLNDLYVLIRWPSVEPLKEYYWFGPECHLFRSYGIQQAYFVPLERLLKMKEPV